LCYLEDDNAPTLRHKVSNFSRFVKEEKVSNPPSSPPSPQRGEGNKSPSIPLFQRGKHLSFPYKGKVGMDL